MNTIVRQHLSSSPYAGQSRLEPSAEAKQLLSLGRNRSWDFRILGRAPMPEKPVWLGEWILAPAQGDSTAVPVRSLARVQAIFLAGIRPQGFVLVHEAPKLLKAPHDAGSQEPGTLVERYLGQSTIKWMTAVGGALVLAVAAAAGLVMIAAAVVALASVLIVPAVLMAAALGVDPILVAVTDDDEWIEIDRWRTE